MDMRPAKGNPFVRFMELTRLACERLYPGIGRYDRVVYGRISNIFSERWAGHRVVEALERRRRALVSRPFR